MVFVLCNFLSPGDRSLHGRAVQALSQCLPLNGGLLLIQHALLEQEAQPQDQGTRGHGYLKTTQAAFEVGKGLDKYRDSILLEKQKFLFDI